MKEKIAKINKTKCWFFEKIDKIFVFEKTNLGPDSEKGIKSVKLEIKRERLWQTMKKYKGS